MIYQIRHSRPIPTIRRCSVAACTLRLTPRDAAPQKVLESELEITPRATRQAERVGADSAMKTVVLSIETPHKELRIEARSRVEVERRLPPAPGADACLGGRPRRGLPNHRRQPDFARALPVSESARAAAGGAFRLCARRAFGRAATCSRRRVELMARIKADFAYDRRATRGLDAA